MRVVRLYVSGSVRVLGEGHARLVIACFGAGFLWLLHQLFLLLQSVCGAQAQYIAVRLVAPNQLLLRIPHPQGARHVVHGELIFSALLIGRLLRSPLLFGAFLRGDLLGNIL